MLIFLKVPSASQVQLAWAVLSNSAFHFLGKEVCNPGIQLSAPYTLFKLSSEVTQVTFLGSQLIHIVTPVQRQETA